MTDETVDNPFVATIRGAQNGFTRPAGMLSLVPERREIPRYWLDEAHAAIEAAAVTHPDLTWAGFGPGHAAPIPECVATALAFLKCGPVVAVRTLKTGRGSYGLKHAAECWGRLIGFESYIGNGDLIVAALHLGLRVKRVLRTPNAFIGVRLIRSTCSTELRSAV